MKKFDVIIIGGGFYGTMLASFFGRQGKKVLIVEKEKSLLMRASYNNQARVHNGYHYPRSFLTALRSNANFKKFRQSFKKAICTNFTMIYAIASTFSKTTSFQFLKFCQQIGSPVTESSLQIKKLFNPHLIEDVFKVEEYIFDANILRKLILEILHENGVKILYRNEAKKVAPTNKGKLAISLTNGRTILAEHVFNCTYSGINQILINSNFEPFPLKHEFTEMPLIEVPDPLKNLGITIMDGPFFGILPFPDRRLHTLHHVRYTPRVSWSDHNQKVARKIDGLRKKSNYLFMIKDAVRYIPLLEQAKYKNSLYEVRTVLIASEESDARPILFGKDYGIKNFHVVMGGKIDNVYDILKELKNSF